jgi:hypothetical protein
LTTRVTPLTPATTFWATCFSWMLKRAASLLVAHRALVLARRCLFQPIPEIFTHPSEDTPGLDFLGKPHDNTKWHYAIWNAGEILLRSYWNYMEIDVLHAVRFIN